MDRSLRQLQTSSTWAHYNWWGFQAWDTLQDSTDNNSIDKAETNLEWQEYFSQLQDTTGALPCHVHLPVCLWIMDPHNTAARRKRAMEMKCYRKMVCISYKEHFTNNEVYAKVQQAIGLHKDLTIVKRHKLKWFGHVSHSSGSDQRTKQSSH